MLSYYQLQNLYISDWCRRNFIIFKFLFASNAMTTKNMLISLSRSINALYEALVGFLIAFDFHFVLIKRDSLWKLTRGVFKIPSFRLLTKYKLLTNTEFFHNIQFDQLKESKYLNELIRN